MVAGGGGEGHLAGVVGGRLPGVRGLVVGKEVCHMGL